MVATGRIIQPDHQSRVGPNWHRQNSSVSLLVLSRRSVPGDSLIWVSRKDIDVRTRYQGNKCLAVGDASLLELVAFTGPEGMNGGTG